MSAPFTQFLHWGLNVELVLPVRLGILLSPRLGELQDMIQVWAQRRDLDLVSIGYDCRVGRSGGFVLRCLPVAGQCLEHFSIQLEQLSSLAKETADRWLDELD